MNNNITIIAGPCVIESAELLDIVARKLVEINAKLGTDIIFKASFDKATAPPYTPSEVLGWSTGCRCWVISRRNMV